MRRSDVRSIEDAFAYITDCNLATVSSMAMLKSRSKSEYQRQVSIAQFMVNWGKDFNVDLSSTRADDIIKNFNGSVETWADQYNVLLKK